MATSGTFKVVKRDPILILWQILALQLMFYLTLATFQAIADVWLDIALDVNQIFQIQVANLRSKESVARLFIHAAASIVCAYAIRLVVCRAKMCLDFAFTIYFVHFLVCWWRTSTMPFGLPWWLLQLLCFTITTVVGEYLCMQVELRDIPVSLVPAAKV